MAGDQAQHQRRVAIVVEVGPVHGDQDVLRGADLSRHPAGEAGPDVDARVAHQPIDLLDGVLGGQPARQGQGLADRRHRQRSAGHDPECGGRKGIDAFGVQVGAVYPAEELADGGYPSAGAVRLGHGSRPVEDDGIVLRNRGKSRLWATRENEGIRERRTRLAHAARSANGPSRGENKPTGWRAE